MAIRLPGIIHAKKLLRRSLYIGKEEMFPGTPKGYLVVYIGEDEKKRYTVPLSYLNQPLFQDLLNRVEEEFGYDHPMGGLTVPCSEDVFINLISQFSESIL
ncbi:hypothetical protein SAY86_026005 [Trapa natans]|uniref:Uncharacterized protein n=1 Tax=Trapa natans TaxID=22666 RepID=A0AAN7QH47_TRANT|nr:hypothetical protein SAY86_026005 [Trapa natans]